MIKFESQFKRKDSESGDWFRYSTHETAEQAKRGIKNSKTHLHEFGFEISKLMFRVVEHKQIVIHSEEGS